MSAVNRIEETINDVLDFRQLDTNMLRMQCEAHVLSTVVEDACRRGRDMLPPSVQLWCRISSPSSVVIVDARRITQIITHGLRCVVMDIVLPRSAR
jgi:signal transduction histidine kinase